MHLRIERLALNDTWEEDLSDEITEEKEGLENVDLYCDQVRFPQFDESLETDSHNGIRIEQEGGIRRVVATKNYKLGEPLAVESDPICWIPPLDKLTLALRGKCCACCGKSLSGSNISPHFIMTHGLDCSDCDVIWCSKRCKTKDQRVHTALHHGKHKLGAQLHYKEWLAFESYCHDNDMVAAHSVAVILAVILVNNDSRLQRQWDSLATVSQKVRLQPGEIEKGSHCFELLQAVFPESELVPDFESFMELAGRFDINQTSQQLYFIASFLNHSCEPNAHFEVNEKNEWRLFARASISPGDELFITYINPLHNVYLRQRELRQKYGFNCECHRCKFELSQTTETPTILHPMEPSSMSPPASSRRKSSMRSKRPDLTQLLKNGQEFDLDIPENPGFPSRRRTSVRFDGTVSMAVEEE
ncbi:similar to Saccharomyces cerevisiae YHR207C SET5 Zinc-finger protein of unknown function, contains one canonical and two unusual fingers in unusual arrangements [Maudiozyma barnettii]|uniref:Histone-lysine N-methyltransferase SET5 n=1 Tax=Maudiozyma barnettii TaxID=61262 RepID=A0A8H2VGF9_9SACH|nr:S-adenosylmethionine-dependent methyltransferase [Kazachstania barnettii]CAB4255191.1 similar to Saccharomyces cerevisiae YHR207C SET5 Zinc-finger protein of unknown function, contains one canonical and two unusual fingers in unusual arrangements [Kazachstania barnettii]CAD1783473.1 similar to Saccharomyces cerevisiae YHR207C SET5 Zinc-finger protein of unknown function, contains one canonical and two unusual fingers in unusual arrangements [Kazachstania barnettii]